MTTETTEEPTVDDRGRLVGVQKCPGGCGRDTRPSKWPVSRAPGTVPRGKGGLCTPCQTKDSKAERKQALADRLSPERVDRLTADLDAFMQRMRRSSRIMAAKRNST